MKERKKYKKLPYRKIILTTTLILVVTLFISYFVFKKHILQNTLPLQSNLEEINEPYDYPIKPGSEEWKQFQSHKEMINACQIPEDLLKRLSTDALVETVINYPLYGDFLAYNNMNQGFENIKSTFNGIQELITRPDSGSELLSKYIKYDVISYCKSCSLEEQGKYAFDLNYIELLFSQPEILNTLTPQEHNRLNSEVLYKFNQEIEDNNIYGIASIERIVYLAYQNITSGNMLIICNLSIDFEKKSYLFRYYATFIPYQNDAETQQNVINNIMSCVSLIDTRNNSL